MVDWVAWKDRELCSCDGTIDHWTKKPWATPICGPDTGLEDARAIGEYPYR